MSHIFISYSRSDIAFAGKIVQALADNKLDTWIDWKSIPKGEDWEQEIYRGIEEADAFLFLISADSVASQMCNKEIAHAVKNGKRMLPIVIRDADLKTIHPEISKRNWIFCRDGQDDFNKAIEEIHKTIHTDYEWLKYHTQLQNKALAWERAKKDNSRLLRGKELREAEQQLAEVGVQEDPQPTKIQREYILASQRTEIRTRRQITIGLVIGLGIMVVLSFVAWGQRNSAISAQNTAVAEANAKATALVNEENARATAQAEKERAEEQTRIAIARQLAAQANTNLSHKNLDIALLLSIEALNFWDSYETRGMLLTSLNYNPQLTKFLYTFGMLENIGLSPDGKVLVSGSSTDSMQIWNFETYQLEDEIYIGDRVNSIAFSSDNKYFAISTQQVIYIWDMQRMEKIKEFEPYFYISTRESSKYVSTSLSFSSSDDILAAAGFGNAILLWDIENGELLIPPLTDDYPCQSIHFFSNDERLICGNSKEELVFWNWRTSEKRNYPFTTDNSESDKTEEGMIDNLAISPDEKIVAGNIGENIYLFDLKTYQPRNKTLIGHTSIIEDIMFSLDGNLLISGSWDEKILVWDIETGKLIGNPLVSPKGPILSLAISKDGKSLISGTHDGAILIWNIGLNLENRQLTYSSAKHIDLGFELSKLVVSPDGQNLVVGGCLKENIFWCEETRVIVWDIWKNEISEISYELQNENITKFAFDNSDNMLVSGGCESEIQHNGAYSYCTNGSVRIFDAGTGKQKGKFQVYDDFVWSVSISPDGNTIIAGGCHTHGFNDRCEEGEIRIWNIAGKSLHDPIYAHTGGISNIVFSPNGMYFATSSWEDNQVNVWDARTGDLYMNLYDPTIDGFYRVTEISFSQDSKILAAGRMDNTITLWDLRTSDIVKILSNEFGNWVTGLLFVDNDKTLVASYYENYLAFWDVNTGFLISDPIKSGTVITSIDKDPISEAIISSNEDGTVTFWDISIQHWFNSACEIVGRNFTQTEWQQYFPVEPYHITCPQWPAGE